MKSILLVDDDPHIIRALSEHINWAALDLHVAGTAASGTEALELFYDLQPDLLMTDVYLPGMNGLELTRKLRGDYPNLPIIILSGYDEFENARAAMRWGVSHFLLKPAEVDEITSVLQEVMLEYDVRERHEQLELSYRQEVGRVLPYLRKQFMKELLTTRYRPEQLSRERMDYIGIQHRDQVRAVSLQLNRPKFVTRMKERDWQLLRYGAADIIQENAALYAQQQGQGQVELVDYSDRVFVLVVLEQHSALDTLHVLLERIIQQIFTYLKIEVSAGIGLCKSDLCELMDSYLESCEALENAEFQGGSRIYCYEHDMLKQSPVPDHSAALRQWNDAWNDMRTDAALDIWHTLRSQLESGHCLLQDVQVVAVSLFDTLIHSWNRRYPRLESPLSMSEFLRDIQSKYALTELTGWMDELIHHWLEHIQREQAEKKSNRLVAQVKQYVEQHYAEEISFEAIARSLYVHPKYLSQLFKRMTGENFVSYLNQYRIERALALLESGQYMVYEVSEMTGFRNATYFSQVFKMVTGKSPSEVVR